MALTTAGRTLTRDHKLEQIRLGARFVAASQILLGELNPTRLDATMSGWLGLQVLLGEAFHRDSTNLAAAYLSEYRAAEVGRAGAGMPIVRTAFDAATTAQKSALLVPMAKNATAGGLAARAAVDHVFWQLVNEWRTESMAGGRDLVDESTLANNDSIGWRRVTDGDPCTWCAMLATRGPTYRSAETAGEGRFYHPRCGCTAEEVFGEWVPTAEEQRFIDLYEASHEPGMSAQETAAAMRENGQGVVNDAHKPKTHAGGSGGRGGRRGPPAGFGEPPDPSDRDAWLDYWRRRQDALEGRGLTSNGESLEPHEVEFAERFTEQGQHADWIPKDPRRRPTNDFLWIEQDLKIELKSVSPDYMKIHGRIVDATSKAYRNHGVVKDAFIIDIGSTHLTEELREQLAGFNDGRERYRLTHLWVMAMGQLTRIDLR